MTYKKDYNELLLLLLRTLVKDALHFEEIVSGSTSRLTHLEVKMEDLKNKVSLCACFHACPSCELNSTSGF
jgi:DNA replication licensing factor MCM2